MRGVGVAHGGVLKQGEWYPWLVVVSLGLMSAGTTGTYSILAGSFVAPVCSDLGFDYGQFSFYFTATLLGLSFALPFLGKLIPRVVGKAWHVGVELLLIVAGAAMAFYTEVWMFILSAFVIGVCFTFTTGVCSIGYIVGAFGMPVMMEVYRIAGSFQGVFAFCIACNIALAALAVLARLNGKRHFAAVSSLR